MIELVAFLGNPGPEHAGNRHNAGWLLAEKLAFVGRLNWRKKFKGLWADIEGPSLGNAGAADGTGIVNAANSNADSAESVPQKIHFLLPETYMNQSGDSVFQAASFFKIKPEQILVVHDELELAAGTVSLKFGGGLGGHNGLRSMKANFGTPDFWRLRIGIGRPDSRLPGQGGKEGSGRGIVEWVLSDFGAEELAVLEPALEAAAGLLQNALAGGPEKFLPLWAKRNVSALLRAAQ